MVSFLSYNVGGAQQYDHVLAIARLLHTINTSIVCLQEAKWANDESFVNDFVKKSGYNNCRICLSSRTDNHSIVLSNLPVLGMIPFNQMVNSGIIIDIMANMPVRVAALHLAPSPEQQRVIELNSILGYLSNDMNVVMAGDFNAIAPNEHAPVLGLSSSAKPESVKHDAIQLLINSGFHDIGREHTVSPIATVPLSADRGVTYQNLRLDYFFVNTKLAPLVRLYRVIDTPKTQNLSDHLPVFMQLDD